MSAKWPRRRDGAYRPEPALLAKIRERFPDAPAVYDSVTSALKVIHKEPLVIWRIKQALRKVFENPWAHDTIETVMAALHLDLENSADRGKTVHSWVEAFARGARLDIDTVPEQYRGYAKAFLAWERTVRAEVLLTEANVYSVEDWYAGTTDLVLRDPDGTVTLYDFKTNKNADVYRETGLQMTAYLHADLWVKDGEVLPMPAIDRTVAVGLGPDGNYTPREFHEDLDDFLAVLRVYRWVKRGER